MLCTHPVSSDSESGRAARYGNSISRHDRDKLKMELERGNGVAVWRQIETTLTEEIGAQHFAPGEQLPNELLLATRFGVNRHTVRRALSELAEAGLVRIEQGRGTFVQESAIDYTIARRTRFSHNIRSLGLTPSMELLREAELPAPADIADVLEAVHASNHWWVVGAEYDDEVQAFRQAYTSAVAALPAHLRAAWQVIVEEDAPAHVAAAALGIDRTTVWRRVNVSRARLATRLAPFAR